MSDLMHDLMAEPGTPFVVQHMHLQDIPEVMAIEKDSFPLPWSSTAYRHELTQNENSYYIVVRHKASAGGVLGTRWPGRWLKKTKSDWPPIVGYGGFWILGRGAH